MVVVAAAVVGGSWAVIQMLDSPGGMPVTASAADGRSAQQKIYEATRRGGRGAPLVLSEGELNALVSRHLETNADVALTAVSFRLVDHDTVDLTGRLSLGRILAESPLTRVKNALPGVWLGRSVWIRLRARPRLETPQRSIRGEDAGRTRSRYVRMDVDSFWIGRQRLPAPFARLFLDPGALAFLRWRAPAGVEALTIEPGRVIIRVASREAS
jgi:hypothetical protein